LRRSSHAEYVTVSASQLTAKPSAVSWEVAGSLFVAGATAYAAVRAVRLVPGETVAIAGAAGGVGSIAVQLARCAGATVLGIAGPSNDAWLADHGAGLGQAGVGGLFGGGLDVVDLVLAGGGDGH